MVTKQPYKQQPTRSILWRFHNPKARYIIQFIEIRWATSSSTPLSYVLRFELEQITVISILSGKHETSRALKILKHLESTCPSILPNLDLHFWNILTDTVRYSPTNFVYLNQAIRRCKNALDTH